ncbi:helix-turn-helix domain-containing protein [Nonomuraea rhodomycinica]|uniref:Helix-turn-helix transcriptional regulator n=1 Tax=Nonomuraea rhodomycinica TaxID=1712872 RepID=A0A7Y6IJC5_9ACTN|nr:helix-turn-helix transcriptional regulator [Nonomuraea rhodomycinica]NUW39337.1 helix-turn-helix transcriptional regulator [Nonomuraea rhodomycinica]
MTHPPERLPPRFWAAPAVAAALAEGDVPALLDEIRRARGWTQAQLADVVGYSQSWVSKVVRRRQPLTVDQVREVSVRLGVPLQLLRFGAPGGDDPAAVRDPGGPPAVLTPPTGPGRARPDEPPPQSPPGRAWIRPDEPAAQSPTGRARIRPDESAARGPAGSARIRLDESAAQSLTSVTRARRRQEPGTPARELAREAVAHVDLAGRVLGHVLGDQVPGRADARTAGHLRAGLSEAAGFAAWLHGDMQDLGTARGYYRLAVQSARQAGHPLLAAYMIGSRAAFEVEADDPVLALTLVAQARRELGERPPATAGAWLASIEALGHAAGRDAEAAGTALRRAESAIAAGERSGAPPWPWVFPFDQAKLAGYRGQVSVRLGRAEEARSALSESLSAGRPAVKQRGVLLTEMAAAQAMAGRHEEAFQSASSALTVGVTYGSERIIHRARRFRRAYTGPVTATVRTFDERLLATIT